MQRQLAPVNCPNCGAAGPEPNWDICQVCSYTLGHSAPDGVAMPRTAGELRASIDDLLNGARRCGLDHETILRVLHDELTFAAELARPDRHHSVQVIDLGPQELGLREPTSGGRRVTLPVRPVVTGARLTPASSVKPL